MENYIYGIVCILLLIGCVWFIIEGLRQTEDKSRKYYWAKRNYYKKYI